MPTPYVMLFHHVREHADRVGFVQGHVSSVREVLVRVHAPPRNFGDVLHVERAAVVGCFGRELPNRRGVETS